MYEQQATYTPEQLAERWQTSTKNIYRKMNAGAIRYFKLGRQKRIPASEVHRIERGEPEGQSA